MLLPPPSQVVLGTAAVAQKLFFITVPAEKILNITGAV